MAEISNVLKCPKCGGTIVEDECHDLAISNNQAYGLYTGHCEQCYVDVQWDEIYNFSHYKNIIVRD